MSAERPDIEGSPYRGYVYAYPHKTAYRAIEPLIALDAAWREEAKHALLLYLHVPFCEFRCGFCNLFTTTGRSVDFMDAYLDALERQADRMLEALGPTPRFVRLAIGGGTPTVLDAPRLRRLLRLAARVGADPACMPSSVEVSPATLDRERLEALLEAGVSRISIGVQTFDATRSAHELGRPQRTEDVHGALSLLRERRRAILNIDLIYGGETQTTVAWLEDLEHALIHEPDELYLYPLYVRRLTGLAKIGRKGGDARLEAYRAARERLLRGGYEQVSMRFFRRRAEPDDDGLAYCCQRDGMVGLGAGARSYTSRLHYSTEFAVGRAGVREILDAYTRQTRAQFGEVRHGFFLGPTERRRRFLLQSLLQVAGLARADYREHFGTDVLDDFPELAELKERGWAREDAERVVLTAEGLERSDAIGPWLASAEVRKLMGAYEWR